MSVFVVGPTLDTTADTVPDLARSLWTTAGETCTHEPIEQIFERASDTPGLRR